MSVEMQWLHDRREDGPDTGTTPRPGAGSPSRPPTKEAATLAGTLRRAQLDGSVELAAAAACNELGRLHDTVDLTLHAFVGEGLTECLAEHRHDGDTTPGGRSLSREAARRAYQCAAGGPWTETTQPSPVHDRGNAPVLPGPRTAAWVPLSAPGQVLGVIMISVEGVTGEDPLRRVSEAMVTAAELAPTITSLLGPGLATFIASEERRARLEQVMGAFFPVFQPIVELGNRRVEGYEALTRFEDGTRPDLRLAEAASLGGLVPMDAALCRAALDAVPQLPEAPWVALNVSPLLLMDTATLRDVMGVHDGRPVVLEVTEHQGVDDYAAVRRAVDKLGLEVRLSVDDVGDGWSCLRSILDLRPSFIKIDTSWVRGIEGDPTRQALVRGLRQFSRRIDCQLIAEGIETEPQLEKLMELEVGLGQGFHLGLPTRPEGPSDSVAGLD
ncbi:MAG: EAL domain-containing protein [Actinomycetota bacterium]|nr:EAL domain-containing protein [Actinomycetota bacterium]